MVTHMKTTIDIADALFQEAKAIAAAEHTTFRSLVEEGLGMVISRYESASSFELRDASFLGDGVRSDVTTERWDGHRGFGESGSSTGREGS